jgi:hypothetical protein
LQTLWFLQRTQSLRCSQKGRKEAGKKEIKVAFSSQALAKLMMIY